MTERRVVDGTGSDFDYSGDEDLARAEKAMEVYLESLERGTDQEAFLETAERDGRLPSDWRDLLAWCFMEALAALRSDS